MTCSKVFAILGLIAGILNVIGVFFSIARTPTFYVEQLLQIPYANKLAYSLGSDYGLISWFSIVISVAWMIPEIFLLVGISKKKPGFMMVWLVVKMIELVVS